MTDIRIDIAQTVFGFAYGIDRRDWLGYREVFVAPPADIEFDYESYHGRPAGRMGVDQWISAVKPLFTGLDATQHSMSNPIVDVSLDERSARCRVYMQAAHFLWRDDLEVLTGSANPEFTIGGYYDDHLVRSADDRWRIHAVKLIIWWRRGNEAIMRLARNAAT